MANGDNGTVKIHDAATGEELRKNEPKVCEFYLDAFGFDAGQQVTWEIVGWKPTGDNKTVADEGEIVLDGEGHGRTEDMTLPDGHYKLFWNWEGENGAAKHKVFWTECEDSESPDPSDTPSDTPSDDSSEPHGAAGREREAGQGRRAGRGRDAQCVQRAGRAGRGRRRVGRPGRHRRVGDGHLDRLGDPPGRGRVPGAPPPWHGPPALSESRRKTARGSHPRGWGPRAVAGAATPR